MTKQLLHDRSHTFLNSVSRGNEVQTKKPACCMQTGFIMNKSLVFLI